MTNSLKFFWGIVIIIIAIFVYTFLKNRNTVVYEAPEDKSYISDSKDIKDKIYEPTPCYEDLGTPFEREVPCKG